MELFFSSWLLHASLVLLGFTLVLINYFKKAYSYWEKQGVVFLKPTAPFGNMKSCLTLQRSIVETHQTLYNELEGHSFGGYFVTTNPRLLIRDPDLIKQILVSDFNYFHDRGIKVDEKRRPLGAHLIALSGRKWKNLRKKLTSTFTPRKMKMMFPIFLDCANEMTKKLKEVAQNKDCLDMKEVSAQFSADVIGSCAFGLQLNSVNNADVEFKRLRKKLYGPSLLTSIVFLSRLSFPSIYVLLRPLLDDLGTFFVKLVKDMVKYRKENDIKRNDFLQLLIQLKDKENLESDGSVKENFYLVNDSDRNLSKENEIELTDDILAAQCYVFFLAGFDTSSTTVSFCLYELALNTNIQDKLRYEMDTILEKNGRKITYESIKEMEYLNQVIDETLRKYPPAGDLHRECTVPYKISGTDITIDKGMQVFIPVYALHHDPKYYPDPDKFDPERFSEENKANMTPFTYLPFGEGPRICIAMRFGLLQIKVGVTALISNYKFSVCEKTAIPMKLNSRGFVVSAKGGIWLNIEPRSSS